MFSPAQGTGAQFPARLTCLRLSARRKRQRLTSSLRRFGQKSRGRDAKCLRQSFQRIDGDVLRASLNAANVRSIDLRRQCQPLLRQTLLCPELAEVPTNDLAHIHCGQESNINGLTIDGLVVPYFDLRGIARFMCMLGEMK